MDDQVTTDPTGGEATTTATVAPASDRTRLRRAADRGRHDAGTVAAILDEGLLCHVGFAVDGRPWVFPTAYAHLDGHVWLHGATGNFGLRALAAGAEACVTVTLLDGLVLARSAFHHSMNFRSVMLFGRAEVVRDEAEKRRATLAIVDHLVPGRSAATRPPTPQELRATLVVRIPVDEASAKVRTGPPVEDPADLDLDHWAGVVPLTTAPGRPEPDGEPSTSVGVPPELVGWSPAGRVSPSGTAGRPASS